LAYLSARKSQRFSGKVFTNGKFDLEMVARILASMECKQKFRGLVKEGRMVEVRDMFAADHLFSKERGGLTRDELANVTFDSNFRTPLHLAVETGNIELVEFLVASGARPRRCFVGKLPWERLSLLPSFTAAATALRTSLAARVQEEDIAKQSATQLTLLTQNSR